MEIPDEPPADHQEWLAYLYENQDWDALVGASRETLFEDPDADLARLALATAYGRLGRVEDSDALLLTVQEGPLGPEVALHRAYLAAESDAFVAAAWLSRHQDKYPDHRGEPWRTGALARAWLVTGHLDDARALLPDAIPDRVRRRHPWLGAATSAVVPGLGQLIGGQPVEAASAFLVVGTLAAGTAWAVSDDRVGTAVVIGTVGGLFWAGNVYGGADAAVRWNRAQVHQLIDELDDEGVPGDGPPPLP